MLYLFHIDILNLTSRLFSGVRQNPEFAFDDTFFEEILKKKEELENMEEHQQYPSTKPNEELSNDEVAVSMDKTKGERSYDYI